MVRRKAKKRKFFQVEGTKFFFLNKANAKSVAKDRGKKVKVVFRSRLPRA